MVQQKMVEFIPVMPKRTMQMYLRTILLVLSWLIMGICSEIIGPTMGVLAYNIHVTYNGIASALASRSAGGFLNNVVCGIFQRFVNNYQDLMLTIGFIVPTILVAVTPFIRSLLLMCIVFFVHGVVSSMANMGGTSLLLKMWEGHAAAPLNIVHLGYGLGAIIANLLVRPFVNNEISHINSTLSTSISTPLNMDIRVPYMVTAGLCFITGIAHFIFFIRETNNKQDKAKQQKVKYTPIKTISFKSETHPDNEVKHSQYSPAACGHGYFGYGLSLSILFTIYVFFVVGTDQTFAKFYFSYLKFDKFGISTVGASWGIILFWLSFSIGRVIGAIESLFIPIPICLAISSCGCLIVAIMWIIYVWILGLTSTSLFVLGSLTGLVIGPLFALSFAWINQKLNTIPILLAVLFSGGGLGSLVLQKIGGFVMDYDPTHFTTLIIACVIITIMLYIIINVIIFFHERGLKTQQEAAINEAPLMTDKLSDEEEKITNYLQSVNETQ